MNEEEVISATCACEEVVWAPDGRPPGCVTPPRCPFCGGLWPDGRPPSLSPPLLRQIFFKCPTFWHPVQTASLWKQFDASWFVRPQCLHSGYVPAAAGGGDFFFGAAVVSPVPFPPPLPEGRLCLLFSMAAILLFRSARSLFCCRCCRCFWDILKI